MTMMEQLGELYNAQGQFQDSIKVYRNLMVLEPTSPKLCFWQGEVMKNTLSATGSRASADNVKELQRLGAVYEKVKDAKGIKKEQLEECRDTTKNTLGELATVWHKEAQKTNNNDTYALAQYLYKEYLSRFPKEKDIYQMTFYYGELLFKLGSNGDNNSYCNAAPVYTKVVELNPSPSAKYLKEAAYAAVISWKNCLSVEDTGQEALDDMKKKHQEMNKSKTGKEASSDEPALKEEPITENKKKMIAAFDTYIKYVPDSPELPNIKYRKARIYYEANRFNEAFPLFKDIADHHSNSELAYYSTNLLFDCLIFQKKYDDLQGVLDTYCPMYSEKDATTKAQCGTLSSALGRKRIELADKEGRHKDAAVLYMKQAQDYPNDPKIDEVYYSAAVDFERAKLLGSAIKAREILLKTKPDSPLAKKAIYLIGRNFQDIAAYDQAAENYEQFAEKYPGEKEAPVALNSASFFRRGLGENDKAIKDVALYVKDYGGRHEFTDKAASADFVRADLRGPARQRAAHEALPGLPEAVGRQGWRRSSDRRAREDRRDLVAAVMPAAGRRHQRRVHRAQRASAPAAPRELPRSRQKRQAEGQEAAKHKGASLPPTCGPETKSKIVVHDRKPGPLKEAMTHFAEALKLFKGGAADKSVPGKDEDERNGRTASMNYFASEARFKEGDLEYEKFLKHRHPGQARLHAGSAGREPAKQKAMKKKLEENQKKFIAWFENKGKQLETAQKIYQNVILFKQAHWASRPLRASVSSTRTSRGSSIRRRCRRQARRRRDIRRTSWSRCSTTPIAMR